MIFTHDAVPMITKIYETHFFPPKTSRDIVSSTIIRQVAHPSTFRPPVRNTLALLAGERFFIVHKKICVAPTFDRVAGLLVTIKLS